MLANNHTIPQLSTTFVQPLRHLEKHLLARRDQIQQWFASEWEKTVPPVYGSVDLRNAGFKLAPIDMNLFPAGFNNLNPNFLGTAVKAAERIIHQLQPNTKKILVIPESHTRNLLYWVNIKTLQKILEQAGFEVRFGFLSDEMALPATLELPTGETVIVEKLIRQGAELSVANFIPDIVLLNNDLSEGIPPILHQLQQRVIPPAELGWSQRLKSEHFQYYAEVTNEFSNAMGIDPWLVAPLFRHCGKIDFMQQSGMECLIANAEKLFSEIQQKYAEHNIPYQPFLIVKADAGTYGMAVMTVRNVDELKSMNRKQRTRMSMTKGGQSVDRVIIQEGVYTFETVGPEQAVAEPVVYLWGDCVVGGFYRVHNDRSIDENLNAPGMHFEPLTFPNCCNEPKEDLDEDASPNRLYIYGVVARLSMLAAAREMRDQMKGEK